MYALTLELAYFIDQVVEETVLPRRSHAARCAPSGSARAKSAAPICRNKVKAWPLGRAAACLTSEAENKSHEPGCSAIALTMHILNGIISSKGCDYMASINMSIRTDSELKAQAEKVLSKLGMNMTGTINMFLQQIVRDQAVPLSLSLSSEQSLYADLLRAKTDRERGVEYLDADAVLCDIDRAIERGSGKNG